MSGDVQPRKRKDKRRKKESSSLGDIHQPLGGQKIRQKSEDESEEPTIIGSTDPGENIHIHNDHGIGGNVCVKIIFFCLLAALVGLVGVIFIQSRGSTDVDLPSIEDSRFAEYFTGWLDDASDDHGHDDHEVALHSGEEEEDHGDEHDGHDDEEDEEHDEHDEEEEEEEDDHASEEPEQQSAEQDDDKDGDDDENDNDDDDDDDEDADADADADDDKSLDIRQKADDDDDKDNDNDNDNDDDDEDEDDGDDDGLPAKDEQPPSEEEEDEPPPPPPRRSGQSQQVSAERRGRGPQGIEEEKTAPNLPQIEDDDNDNDDNNDVNGDDDNDDDNDEDNDDEGINVSGPDENDLLDNKLPDEDDDWVFRQELDFADDQFDNDFEN